MISGEHARHEQYARTVQEACSDSGQSAQKIYRKLHVGWKLHRIQTETNLSLSMGDTQHTHTHPDVMQKNDTEQWTLEQNATA